MTALLLGAVVYSAMFLASNRIEKNAERLMNETPAAQWGVLIAHLGASIGIMYLIGRGILAVLA